MTRLALTVLALGVLLLGLPALSPHRVRSAEAPATRPANGESTMKTEKATFAAGCFWGVESSFAKVPGVISTQVGYTGGKTVNPTYRQVCTHLTGHAEAIEVTFDPEKLSYQKLLEVFFENHDPTTLNRQGPDVGSQYRSAVFVHSPEQQRAAEEEKDRRNRSGDYARPIVTQIVPAAPFYRAEEYHQKYYEKQGVEGSCHFGNGKKQKAGVR
jgi:peptide-methionine (S)-S-oxide reductase